MTTNYWNTFIEVADDCPAAAGEQPSTTRATPTVAVLQYQLIAEHPYELTSDDVLFEVFARRGDVPAQGRAAAREQFFAKSQACLRASPLPKRHGWGIHHDEDGKVAVHGVDTADYRRLRDDPSLTHVKAMRSARRD